MKGVKLMLLVLKIILFVFIALIVLEEVIRFFVSRYVNGPSSLEKKGRLFIVENYKRVRKRLNKASSTEE